MIKEIFCMPHSHLDIGYTHPQPMLLELQKDYIDQALDLIEKTKDYPEETRFRWTIEGNYILQKWLETAGSEKEARLKQYIREGYICVTALPMHTTPCADAREMVFMLSGLKELEERLETKIHIAITHDVDGQPWTLGQLLLDSGIDFYLTGINIHFGGLPFMRPSFFRWEMSDGRKLPTFLGEHYSLFSQYAHTDENSTERMHEGLKEHAQWLESRGYDKDFMFLTATNPPQQYDNNPPDWNLPDLLQKYNEEQHEYRIRIVTAQMLCERLLPELRADSEAVPCHKGDWTDFWNFGCASTAVETRVSRLAKGALNLSEVLECFHAPSDKRYRSIKKRCQEQGMIYDEHTWGASQSIANPDSPETCSQLIHKKETAYQAADLAGYLAAVQKHRCCSNPCQSDVRQGVLFVNPASVPVTFEAKYSALYREEKRLLSARQAKNDIPYLEKVPCETSGIMTLEPYTAAVVSFTELDRLKEESKAFEKKWSYADGILETPYYLIQIGKSTGRITQITEKKSGKQLLSHDSGYSLFEPVREIIDAEENPPVRETLFGNSVDLRNHDISQWNHDWEAQRITPSYHSWRLEEEDYQVSVVADAHLEGTEGITLKITFYTYRPGIHMEAGFIKEPVAEPEALYFAVPAALKKGWECSYDTAGEIVKLDEEQLGAVCRDYQTVDTAVSIYGEDGCFTLVCPDAPMIQTGDFQFGKENTAIPRTENPLLLAWPLNNYWSTNFMANQSGQMCFSYELYFSESFSKQEMFAEGIRAKYPVSAGLAVHGPFEKKTLLRTEGSCNLLNVFPAKDGGILALLHNPEEQSETFALCRPAQAIEHAAFVNASQEEKQALQTADGSVKGSLPRRSFALLFIK